MNPLFLGSDLNLKHHPKGVVVACSGGRDSTVLLHHLVLLKESGEFAKELCVGHVNVHLRGPESQRDEHKVRELAQKYGLEFCLYEPQSPYQGLGSEELWAREVRRAAYRKWWCEGYGVVLGHHQGDVVETLVFRLIRGSNPWNLRGMQRRGGVLLRPLLEVSTDKIQRYGEAHELSWVEDSSNQNLRHARNQLRHEVLPRLKKVQSRSSDYLLSAAEKSEVMAHFIRDTFHNKIEKKTLAVDRVASLDDPLIQLALEALIGEKLSLTSGYLGEITKVLRRVASEGSLSSYTFSLPQGTLYIQRGRIQIRRGVWVSKKALFCLRHHDLAFPHSPLVLPWPLEGGGAKRLKLYWRGVEAAFIRVWVWQDYKSVFLDQESYLETFKKLITQEEFLFCAFSTFVVSVDHHLVGVWSERDYYPVKRMGFYSSLVSSHSSVVGLMSVEAQDFFAGDEEREAQTQCL